MSDDLDRIEQRVFLKAPPARVWRAMVDREEFETWFRVRLDGEIQAGNTIVMSDPSENPSYEPIPVEIVELVEGDRLVWRWHPGEHVAQIDYSREPQTTVVLSIAPHLDGTMLTVIETGFAAIAEKRRLSILRDNVNGWIEQASSFISYINNAG